MPFNRLLIITMVFRRLTTVWSWQTQPVSDHFRLNHLTPRSRVAEIQAAQERHNAELADVTEQPTLKVAKRYASGRPR